MVRITLLALLLAPLAHTLTLPSLLSNTTALFPRGGDLDDFTLSSESGSDDEQDGPCSAKPSWAGERRACRYRCYDHKGIPAQPAQEHLIKQMALRGKKCEVNDEETGYVAVKCVKKAGTHCPSPEYPNWWEWD